MNGSQQSFLKNGKALAAGKWKWLTEGIADHYDQCVTAQLLENQECWFDDQLSAQTGMDITQIRDFKAKLAEAEENGDNTLLEATTMTSPGIATIERFSFPLIRSIYPSLVASQIVSVQPMTGPTSMIFYMDFAYGSNKGTARKGQPIWETPDKNYSSEIVNAEVIGTGDAAAQVFNGSLTWLTVRPGSIVISTGSVSGTDNSAGAISGTGITGTVNYETGAITVTFTTAPASGDAVAVDYEYDQEASDSIAEIDLVLTSSPVIARTRKLRARYSQESAANLRNQHGIDAEAELTAVLAEELKFEVDREIIDQLHTSAGAGFVAFSKTPPSGVSYQDHKQTFIDKLIEAGQLIFKSTRRAQPNWIVMGTDVANVVEALPGFVSSGVTGTSGVLYTGTLNNRWRCYKDPFLQSDKFVIGYKGNSFVETGFVYAPYIPLYSTQPIILDDFMYRRGFGTWYAKKMVNNRFYATGKVTS